MATLAALYDPDQRSTNRVVRQLARTVFIPHPLNNVVYTDGVSSCRHAKKHHRFENCTHEVIATRQTTTPNG